MKTFKSQQYGFKIEVPCGWSCPPTNLLGRLFGLDRGLTFKGKSRFLNIKVYELYSESEPSLNEIEISFKKHALNIGHIDVETGTLQVGDKYHLWTRYIIGKSIMFQTPEGREIIKDIRLHNRVHLGFLSNPDTFIKDDHRRGIGPVVKRYFLIFYPMVYDIVCTLGYGTISEVKEEFKERETEYDEIVSSFEVDSLYLHQAMLGKIEVIKKSLKKIGDRNKIEIIERAKPKNMYKKIRKKKLSDGSVLLYVEIGDKAELWKFEAKGNDLVATEVVSTYQKPFIFKDFLKYINLNSAIDLILDKRILIFERKHMKKLSSEEILVYVEGYVGGEVWKFKKEGKNIKMIQESCLDIEIEEKIEKILMTIMTKEESVRTRKKVERTFENILEDMDFEFAVSFIADRYL